MGGGYLLRQCRCGSRLRFRSFCTQSTMRYRLAQRRPWQNLATQPMSSSIGQAPGGSDSPKIGRSCCFPRESEAARTYNLAYLWGETAENTLDGFHNVGIIQKLSPYVVLKRQGEVALIPDLQALELMLINPRSCNWHDSVLRQVVRPTTETRLLTNTRDLLSSRNSWNFQHLV